MIDNVDLGKLTDSYLDGTLSGDEAGRLNARLLENQSARREFAERLNLDSAIAAAAAGWQSEQDDLASAPRLALRPISWLALVACVGLLIAGAMLWHGSTLAFATVEKKIGAGEIQIGMTIRGDTHTIDAGTVELLTARGARVIIEAPAVFRFESAQRLHMSRGRLSADVPPSAKGFTVITPSGDAVDLGTRFGVDVPKDGTAEIHVFEGEVIAKTAGTAEELSLRAGEALAMDQGASSTRELRSAAFIQPDEMRDLGADRQAQSDAMFTRMRSDPAAIAALDFESESQHPGVFRTVQGRWPGSHAPEFIHAGDHLKLDVGGERTWPQLTLAAWVRLDQLGAPYQSLLHADGWDNDNFGLVHWMVNEATTMRFATWGNKLAPESQTTIQPYPDSRIPVLSEQGRWVHLATVYDSDAGTVRFYHNGRFDSEARQSTAYPARLGPVQIGNWNRAERKLSGRVDELIVLGRTMGDDEIQKLFEAGNPYR